MIGARPLLRSLARSHLAWCPQHVYSLAQVMLFIALLCSVTHNVPAYLHQSYLCYFLKAKVGSPHKGGAPE